MSPFCSLNGPTALECAQHPRRCFGMEDRIRGALLGTMVGDAFRSVLRFEAEWGALVSDAQPRLIAWRPWHVSVAVLGVSCLAGRYLLTPAPDFGMGPRFAELGAWLVAIGAGQVLFVLSLVALFHRGSRIMYCERGIPGVTTCSAVGVLVTSLLTIAFLGLGLGASLALDGGARRDMVAIALWALGAWLATVAFMPLRRLLRFSQPR